MRVRIFLVALLALIPLMAFGRLFVIIDPKKLIADSKLVFVGKVESVKASGIATTLSYPTWEGVSFPWQDVKMQVLVPFKGVRKGDTVHVMMLSIDNSKARGIMYSLPEVLEPDTGDVFFLCLGPTPVTNTFAALSAPYDEDLSVLPLHRSHETGRDSMRDDGKQLLSDDKRFKLIWQIVNQTGEIVPDKVAKLRRIYAAEIGKTPTNDMVYLEWESYTNAHGWTSDVPKGFSPTNSDGKNE
jgi:hypothetical protein